MRKLAVVLIWLFLAGCHKARPLNSPSESQPASSSGEVRPGRVSAEVKPWSDSAVPGVAPGGTAARTGGGAVHSGAGGSKGGPPAQLEVREGISESLKDFPGYRKSKNLRKTISYSGTSVLRGEKLFAKHCAVCHGANGSGPPRTGYNRNRRTRDLREPLNYRYGASDQAIYRSILYGIPRSPMGSYEKSFTENEVWDLVNFLQSLSK